MTILKKEKLLYNINRCANWEEKYLYIIELGSKLPKPSKDLYHQTNLISGCQSQVWIRPILQINKIIVFEGDSDAMIVKGLIAIIFIIYQNLSAIDIIKFNINDWFNKLSLMKYLTQTRSQGLESIISYIYQSLKKNF